MNVKKWIVLLLALGASAVILAARPQDPESEAEHSELEEQMEHIEGALKSLRRSMRNEEALAQSLEHVSTIQAATITSKALLPPMVESLPEAERAAFVTAYRQEMLDFLGYQIELERALLAGDAEAAKDAFKLVHDMEDKGHERFTVDEE